MGGLSRVAVLVMLGTCACAHSNNSPREAGASGTVVHGVVGDPMGECVEGVAVLLENGEQARFGDITDSEGRYRISGVQAGYYQVVFMYQGESIVGPVVPIGGRPEIEINSQVSNRIYPSHALRSYSRCMP